MVDIVCEFGCDFRRFWEFVAWFWLVFGDFSGLCVFVVWLLLVAFGEFNVFLGFGAFSEFGGFGGCD